MKGYVRYRLAVDAGLRLSDAPEDVLSPANRLLRQGGLAQNLLDVAVMPVVMAGLGKRADIEPGASQGAIRMGVALQLDKLREASLGYHIAQPFGIVGEGIKDSANEHVPRYATHQVKMEVPRHSRLFISRAGCGWGRTDQLWGGHSYRHPGRASHRS